MILRLVTAVLLFCLSAPACTDEIRPAYLQISETSPDIFSIVWKVPAKNNRKLSLEARLPAHCQNQTQADAQFNNGAYLQRWISICKGGLVGEDISIEGLESTITDALLRIELMNDISHSVVLTPSDMVFVVPAQASRLQLAGTYSWLGVEHILLGIDHLLFVFALLLIVKNFRRLVGTITSFTLAHSITLAAATLGFIHVPQQPVEAIIALSILFLAMEIVHTKRGHPGAAARWPWLIAFIFGLLHGFGFAGALAEVGLPENAISIALVFFNVGVELGQIVFISGVLALGWLLHKLTNPKILSRAETLVVYAIGSLSSFWLFERVSAF